jgi:hypothetical protein
VAALAESLESSNYPKNHYSRLANVKAGLALDLPPCPGHYEASCRWADYLSDSSIIDNRAKYIIFREHGSRNHGRQEQGRMNGVPGVGIKLMED